MSAESFKSEQGDRLGREAAAWLIRRDRGLTGAEQDEFFQWLAADPRHSEAFAREQRTWRDFDLLADWRPEHGSAPNPDLLARPVHRNRWRRWAAGLGLAASVALAAVYWQFHARGSGNAADGPTLAVLPVDAYQRRTLSDGSSVELRGSSEVQIEYSATERRVWLVSGEAYFNVAKDPARPFIVAARGLNVRAVGTAFNVRLGDDAVEVLVTGGKVQLVPAAETTEPAPAVATEPTPAEPARAVPAPTLLAAGSRALVPLLPEDQPGQPRVESVTAAEIGRLLDWHPKLLDFDSTPLAEVVRQFNRRNRVQLVLGAPALGKLPIVASVQSNNVEGFVRLLERTASVKAERRGEVITLRPVE